MPWELGLRTQMGTLRQPSASPHHRKTLRQSKTQVPLGRCDAAERIAIECANVDADVLSQLFGVRCVVRGVTTCTTRSRAERSRATACGTATGFDRCRSLSRSLTLYRLRRYGSDGGTYSERRLVHEDQRKRARKERDQRRTMSAPRGIHQR